MGVSCKGNLMDFLVRRFRVKVNMDISCKRKDWTFSLKVIMDYLVRGNIDFSCKRKDVTIRI